MKEEILPAEGKLGILMPGLGAVATTFIAGVEAVKKIWPAHWFTYTNGQYHGWEKEQKTAIQK